MTFSEDVDGFETGDVQLGGTAGATTAIVTPDSGDPLRVYDVAVSGMTTSGTVTAVVNPNRATDAAGNDNLGSTSTDNAVTYSADGSAPVITPNIVGTLGSNGWYISDVNLTWSVTDPESTVTSITGCGPSDVTSDTPGTTFTCSATSAGGTNSVSVTIKRDASAPNAPTGAKTPSANLAGWNNTDVTVSFSSNGDNGPSGVDACTASSTLTLETDGTDVSGTCTDKAGNTGASTTVSVKIDKTKPVITGDRTPLANTFGWNNTDVVVSFMCADSGAVMSGITTNTVLGATLTDEGENQEVTNTGACVDAAGNTADAATVSNIDIDKTAPNAPTGTRSPLANAAGWNNSSPVTVSFTENGDAGSVQSGIDTCTAGSDVTGETNVAGTDKAGTCTDRAGNVSSTTTVNVKIDLTVPVVNVVGVTEGTEYDLGSVPAISCSTTDALSGVSSSATLTVTGGVPLA